MNSYNQEYPSLGIIGGMGPLVSSNFIKDIYENILANNIVDKEQDLPNIILASYPSIPDRTGIIQSNQGMVLKRELERLITGLNSFKVDKIIITCFTAHFVCLNYELPLKNKLISLVDLVFQELNIKKKQTLLLGTSGFSTTLQTLDHFNEYLLYPDFEDQAMIDKYIHLIKLNKHNVQLDGIIHELCEKYSVNQWLAGCTEFYLLKDYKQEMLNHNINYIDPLESFVESFCRGFLK